MEKDWEDMKLNLLSSVRQQGKYVTQIIHFVGGEKKTIEGVDVESIRQGQMTKFKLKDGSYVMINDKNVLMVEVFSEKTI